MADQSDDDYENTPQPVWKLLLEHIEGLRWSIATLVCSLDEQGAVKWQRVTETLRSVANSQHDKGARGVAEYVAQVADAIELLGETKGRPGNIGKPSLKVVKPDDEPSGAA